MFMFNRLQSLLAACALAASFIGAPRLAHAQASAADSGAAAAAVSPAAPVAAAPSTAPVGDPLAAKETVDNPYGLGALWAQGDFVAKFVLVFLALMSMGSWYVIITKLYESMKLTTEAKQARKGFFKALSVSDGVKTLKEGSAFRYIAQTAMDAGVHHEGALTDNIDRNTWVTNAVQRSVDDVQSRLQDGLALLATVGSTSPFVGLFGTVWGIYHALTAIGIAGQASIDKVAGPVGEALIMTAIGLAVAVPAVLGYNWLVRRNKVAMESVRAFGADLHGVLMGAKLASVSTVKR
jgi:biopolymer transport protein ExbB